MSESSFTLPSFAKINLHLRIAGKRPDGYHELCTIFQTVSLSDSITFAESETMNFSCDNEKIPIDDNLIVKASELLRAKFEIKKGAKIHLKKDIPAPGGLGGGSSNAAVALMGLAQLWKIKLRLADLCEIGAAVGSDVPFFFYGGTALGTGRGTEITRLKDFAAENVMIVTPNADVATRAAFARINAPDLTNKSSKSILKICRDEAESLYLRQSELINDFEKTVFELVPETARAKSKLFDCGAKYALLSGSGASVFAIFDSDLDRQKAFDRLKNERDWRVFAVQTVSHRSYRNALGFDKILHS